MKDIWKATGRRGQVAIADGYEYLGWQGVTGLVLVVVAFAAYLSLVRPEMARTVALSAELGRMARRVPVGNIQAAPPRVPMTDFYSLFPPANRASLVLEKVVAAADQQGLKLEQGEYRFVRDPGGELIQLHMMLPVKGSYAQVRKFIAAALGTTPSLALEAVQMERDRIGEPMIEARIRLLAFLREKP